MSKAVVILGAGASSDFGVPTLQGIFKDIYPEIISAENKKIFQDVAVETSKWASDYVRNSEAADLQTLRDKGMKVIGVAEGLKIDEFRTSVMAVVDKRFGAKWGKYYEQIRAIK